LPPQDVRQSLESMRVAMAHTAQGMPTHEDFIRRYCAANIS